MTTRGAPPDLPTRALVPKELRPTVRVLAVVAALVVAVLGVGHRSSSGPDASDRVVTATLRILWPRPGTAAYAVDGLVTLLPILVTVGLLAAASLLSRHRRLAVLTLLGPFCVAAATTGLKPMVGRTIHGDNLSFPSGHAGYATAIGLLLGLLLVGLVRPAGPASAALLLLVPPLLVGCFMAADQVVINAHYPSDTVGGCCTALAVVLSLALVLDTADRAWRRRVAAA